MAQILIRNLNEDAIERLRARAKQNQRSLEAEVRDILESEAVRSSVDVDLVRRWAEEMRRELEGIPQTDSVEILREARER